MSLVPKPFHELLKMHFIIPPYQRGYRWESRQVEELLDDLLDFVKSMKSKRNRNNEGREPYYCLQPIAVVSHPKNVDTYFVVDGQQRLTTIYILMHYLSKNSDYEYPVYEFSLPSRDIQNEYLAKLEFMEDDKKYIDNIDNFYVKKAYSTIVAWFSRDGHDRYKGKIRDIFAMVPDDDEEQNDVRVIWYEISGKEAHRAFRELNYGKIPLTSTELVKALLLQERNINSSGHYSRGASYRRALEWDSMEHALQNPYLWSMLAEANDGTLSHMELVLDFVADRLNNEMTDENGNRPVERKESKNSRDDFNYQVINEYLRRNDNSSDTVEDVWKRIQIIFNLVSNWYSNRHWYHLIGLCRILQVGKQRKRRDFVEYIYKMSVDENGTPIDRPQFTGRLEKEVGRLVRLGKGITLESLRYDENNDAIIRVLKLLNVQEAINDNTEEKRFAFHLFEIFNVTSLEHIHPQNITSDIGFEDFRMWFERRSEDFYKLDDAELRALLQNDISNNPDSETMDMDWRIAEKKQEVEKAISVLKYLTSDKKIFSDDYNQNELDRNATILDRFFGDLAGIKPEDMHSIRNLAMVDKKTNSAMQNYLLDRKRSILMDRHDSCDVSNPKNLKGTYAPPATRKVFCKEYSRCSPGDMRLWRPEDRNNYFRVINDVYDYYTLK